MNMNFVDEILGECESIIAETENIAEDFSGDQLDDMDFSYIRDSAEELQSLVVALSENKSMSGDMLEELDEQSITLYQNIKYMSQEAYEAYTTEAMQSFDYMKASIDAIRNIVLNMQPK